MRRALRIARIPVEFQSTPTNTGGRCLCPLTSATRGMSFQSTPTNTGGRCGGAPGYPRCTPSFNPRPPILAGDALPDGVFEPSTDVSIHAHQYWRAMPPPAAQASPARAFQSTPTNTGGRCKGFIGTNKAVYRFNPRPPILAGDAADLAFENAGDAVSIHAHQYWRAMRGAPRAKE